MADRPCHSAPSLGVPVVGDYVPEVEPDEVLVFDSVPNFVYDAGPPARKVPLIPDPSKEKSLRQQ
eukprot:11904773-Prorocentrum_lima.AAC.1